MVPPKEKRARQRRGFIQNQKKGHPCLRKHRKSRQDTHDICNIVDARAGFTPEHENAPWCPPKRSARANGVASSKKCTFANFAINHRRDIYVFRPKKLRDHQGDLRDHQGDLRDHQGDLRDHQFWKTLNHAILETAEPRSYDAILETAEPRNFGKR